MWLPARGSLHTVVLLTPGKWAARWTCLAGLLMIAAPCDPGQCSLPAAMRCSGGGVAVGGAGKAEQAAQRGGLVSPPERPALLQLRHEAAGDLGQVVRDRRGPEPESGQPRPLPVLQQISQLRRRPGENGQAACVHDRADTEVVKIAPVRTGEMATVNGILRLP